MSDARPGVRQSPVMRPAPSDRDMHFVLFVLSVLLIGYLDYATGPTISLTLLYLIPVAGAGWVLGQRRAVVVAVIAGAVSLIDALTGSTTTTAALVCNAPTRALSLTIAAMAVE